MDVLCELYPVEMTAIFASKRIFAAAATGGARTAELPTRVCYSSPVKLQTPKQAVTTIFQSVWWSGGIEPDHRVTVRVQL